MKLLAASELAALRERAEGWVCTMDDAPALLAHIAALEALGREMAQELEDAMEFMPQHWLGLKMSLLAKAREAGWL